MVSGYCNVDVGKITDTDTFHPFDANIPTGKVVYMSGTAEFEEEPGVVLQFRGIAFPSVNKLTELITAEFVGSGHIGPEPVQFYIVKRSDGGYGLGLI